MEAIVNSPLPTEVSINEIMEVYYKDVYLLAYSFVKDQQIAEDIAQDVFIKCYKYLNSYRGEAPIKSWICTITVNTAKDYLRKKKVNVFTYSKQILEELLSTESAEVVFEKNNEKDVLLQKVLALPFKYREVIILHYFYDLKISEVGTMLELKENTVKTRLSRGRDLLKKQLKREGGYFGR
ncbi:sigma-70 family RNA polymerase sigma factor [Bacillus sp. BGMRC 2118]|nr:sigma-70 family RNA polymerase sigma factor [Bacillus sp. BGMRC 2118]